MYVITNISKFHSFQYRLLTNCLLLNNRLFEVKITNYDFCSFCKAHKEMYNHFFYVCVHVENFWSSTKDITNKIRPTECHFTVQNIILNNPLNHVTHIANLIVLIAKQILFHCKYHKIFPNASLVQKEIEFVRNVERNQAFQKGTVFKYNMRWNDNLVIENEPDTCI